MKRMMPRIVLAAACGLLSAATAPAQTLTAEIKAHPGAPLTITSAECSPTEQTANRCVARFQVGATDIVAAGFRWVFTYADGSHTNLRQFFDAQLGRGIAFRAGELGDSGGTQTGVKSADGKPMAPVKAVVELEFVVPASGKAWGNLQSPTYWQMLGQRQGFRQAVTQMRSAYRSGGTSALLKELDTAGKPN
jgi:hypothetical protein